MKRPDRDHKRGGAQRTKKRPYKKPRILSREKLEAMAADCSTSGGKSDATCTPGPVFS
jgi:NAD(P)H-flavin reductase